MNSENNKIIRVDGNEIDGLAKRHNELVTSKFRLSYQAHRFFLFVLSQVKDDHDEDNVYEFSVYELAKKIGIDRGHLYKSAVDVLDELARSIVEVQAIDADGKAKKNSFVRIGLIKNRQEVKMVRDGERRVEGAIAVSLYKELLPYVRELKGLFTQTELKYVFRLTSSYSQKLYDLLKSRAFTGKPWRVPRSELYDLLVIEKGKFALFGDFRRFVLEKAQVEICTHTDLAFDVEYVSQGRAVKEIIFHLRKEGGSEVELLPGTTEHQAFKGMVDLGLPAKAAKQVIEDWWGQDPERVTWHLREARRRAVAGKVRNACAWFRKGLVDDYRPNRSLFNLQKKAAEKRARMENDRKSDLMDVALKSALDGIAQKFGGGSPGTDGEAGRQQTP